MAVLDDLFNDDLQKNFSNALVSKHQFACFSHLEESVLPQLI